MYQITLCQYIREGIHDGFILFRIQVDARNLFVDDRFPFLRLRRRSPPSQIFRGAGYSPDAKRSRVYPSRIFRGGSSPFVPALLRMLFAVASLTETDQVSVVIREVRSVFQMLDVMDLLRFSDPSVPLAYLTHIPVTPEDLLSFTFPLSGFVEFNSFFVHGKKKPPRIFVTALCLADFTDTILAYVNVLLCVEFEMTQSVAVYVPDPVE